MMSLQCMGSVYVETDILDGKEKGYHDDNGKPEWEKRL